MVDRRALNQVKVGPCATAQVTPSGASPALEAVSVGGKPGLGVSAGAALTPYPSSQRSWFFHAIHIYEKLEAAAHPEASCIVVPPVSSSVHSLQLYPSRRPPM